MPPYPRFHFAWFQLPPLSNVGPETDDYPSDYPQMVSRSLRYVTMPTIMYLTSSHHV